MTNVEDPAHPDAVANKPTTVLFDENESDLTSLNDPQNGFSFRYEDAISGSKCLPAAGRCR